MMVSYLNWEGVIRKERPHGHKWKNLPVLLRYGLDPSVEDPLQKEITTHSLFLPQEIWTEGLVGYSQWGPKKILAVN